MKEVWKPVVGYEGWYEVSDQGLVKRVRGGVGARAGVVLKGIAVTSGHGRAQHYLRVNLMRKGRRSMRGIHSLVCEAFHGPPPTPKHQVDHKDWNAQNNKATNLRWYTSLQNNRHRNPATTPPRGSQISKKLVEDDVRVIRKRVEAGDSRAAVGRDYDLPGNHIGKICRRESWAHVK